MFDQPHPIARVLARPAVRRALVWNGWQTKKERLADAR
jgi:hypothetical protein